MRVTIRYTDPKGESLKVKELQHVSNWGIHQAGIYIFNNADGQSIFQVPVGLVQDVDFPDHDTPKGLVELATGKVTL